MIDYSGNNGRVGYQNFSSGIRIKHDIDLENTIKNFQGIMDIEKIM